MGVVNTTYTFTGTDTITSSKLNNIIDDTTFTSDAISGSSLQIVSPGKLAVAAGGITANELASNSVTTAKILNLNVTDSKLASTLDLSSKTVTLGSTVTFANNSVPTSALAEKITSGTLVNASGTSVTFTGIPNWVKRITVLLKEVNVNSSLPIVQLGDSGGIESTNYVNTVQVYYQGNGINTSTSVGQAIATGPGTITGAVSIELIGSNTWIFSGNVVFEGSYVNSFAGRKTLSGTLTQLRLTTVSGTASLSTGSINIIYE